MDGRAATAGADGPRCRPCQNASQKQRPTNAAIDTRHPGGQRLKTAVCATPLRFKRAHGTQRTRASQSSSRNFRRGSDGRRRVARQPVVADVSRARRVSRRGPDPDLQPDAASRRPLRSGLHRPRRATPRLREFVARLSLVPISSRGTTARANPRFAGDYWRGVRRDSNPPPPAPQRPRLGRAAAHGVAVRRLLTPTSRADLRGQEAAVVGASGSRVSSMTLELDPSRARPSTGRLREAGHQRQHHRLR